MLVCRKIADRDMSFSFVFAKVLCNVDFCHKMESINLKYGFKSLMAKSMDIGQRTCMIAGQCYQRRGIGRIYGMVEQLLADKKIENSRNGTGE